MTEKMNFLETFEYLAKSNPMNITLIVGKPIAEKLRTKFAKSANLVDEYIYNCDQAGLIKELENCMKLAEVDEKHLLIIDFREENPMRYLEDEFYPFVVLVGEEVDAAAFPRFH